MLQIVHRALRGVLGKKITRLQICLRGSTTQPSCIRLNVDSDEFNIRYNLYLDSALNWLDSGDLTDISS